MILLKTLLSEKIQQDVAWVGKAYEFAQEKKFPLTPSIGKLMNKNKRVTAFHVTSPEIDNLKRFKSLEGSKKSISCMTKIPQRTTDTLQGIHRHGVMFHVEGDLIIKGKVDIMSEPDEQGRRWFKFDDQLNTEGASELQRIWTDMLNNDSKRKKIFNSMVNEWDEKKIKNLYRDFIKRHVELAEEFTKKYAFKIRRTFVSGDIDDTWSPWNELLLNNIKLLDVIFDEHGAKEMIEMNYFRKKLMSKDKSYTNDNQEDYIKDELGKIEKQLKSMVSGKVTKVNIYKPKSADKIKSFVTTKGGKISKA